MATCTTAQIAPVVASRAQLATSRPVSYSRASSSTSATSKLASHKPCPRQISRVVCAADGSKGFAAGGSKKGNKRVNISSPAEIPKGWENAGNVKDYDAQPRKPIISPYTKEAFMVFMFEGKFYATEANGTAFKYPLVDAEIFNGEKGVVLKVPLDGTSYDLTTGEVLEWCPTDNFVRGIIGGLKKKTAPVALKVFQTKVASDGTVIFKGQQ